MISRLTLALLTTVVAQPFYAQSVSTQMGARAVSLGYSVSSLSDEWSIFNNIAGIASMKEATAGVAYELRPMLPGADRMAAVASAPTSFGTFAGGIFRFGDDLYSEHIITAGYSNQFGIASLGLKVDYIQYSAEGFGTTWAIGVGFGGIANITPEISVGAFIQNLNQPTIGPDDEHLPTIMTAGIRFDASQKLILLSEVTKDISFQPTVRFGLEYEVAKSVFMRTGYNLNPNAGFGGLGYKAKRLKVDYGFQFSNGINASHQLSTSWQITSSKK